MNVLKHLEEGRVYKTMDFLRWDANPNRLLAHLAAEGFLRKLGHGLWFRPRENRFGQVPARDEDLLDAYLGKGQYLQTGSYQWNALGLGTTQLWKMGMVYNQHVEGLKTFGAKEFLFKRRTFPLNPDAEWFVVDLFNNRKQMSVTIEALLQSLLAAIESGKFSSENLADNFLQWGSKEDAKLVLKYLRPKLTA